MNEPYTPKTLTSVAGDDVMRVYCRLKPILPNAASCIKVISDTTVHLSAKDVSKTGKQCTFKSVFTETKTQKEIFNETALPLIERLVHGQNGLLFTYGVTGSGKTYTMTGTEQDNGIMPRCLKVLFNSIEDFQANRCTFKPNRMNGFVVQTEQEAELDRDKALKKQEKHGSHGNLLPLAFENIDTQVTIGDEDNAFAVFITYVEIYNDLVYDLLDSAWKEPQSKPLRRDASGNTFVHGVTEIEVKSTEEALELFHRGQKRKHTGVTRLNNNSSRSHCLFNIRLIQAPLDARGEAVLQDNKKIHVSQLSLVDLAGSERTNRTQNTGIRLEEGSKINQSLLSLRNCLRNLRKKQKTPSANVAISFRECKVMFLLKSFFENGGDCRMIVCVNPDIGDAEENVLVMQFAESSQDIVVKATPMTVGYSVGLTPGRRRVNQAYRRTLEMLEEIREHDLSSCRVSANVGNTGARCYRELQEKIRNLEEGHKAEISQLKKENQREMATLKAEIYAEITEFKRKILQEFNGIKNWKCASCNEQNINEIAEDVNMRQLKDTERDVMAGPTLFINSETPKLMKTPVQNTRRMKRKRLLDEFNDESREESTKSNHSDNGTDINDEIHQNDSNNLVIEGNPSQNLKESCDVNLSLNLEETINKIANTERKSIEERDDQIISSVSNDQNGDKRQESVTASEPNNSENLVECPDESTATEQTPVRKCRRREKTKVVRKRAELVNSEKKIEEVDIPGEEIVVDEEGCQNTEIDTVAIKKPDTNLEDCIVSENPPLNLETAIDVVQGKLGQHGSKNCSTFKPINNDCLNKDDDENIGSQQTEVRKCRGRKRKRDLISKETQCANSQKQTEGGVTSASLSGIKLDETSHQQAQHRSAKLFRCEKCNKNFRHRGNLNQHARIHLGIKPYACSRCDKKFTQKGSLDQHMNIHLGIKPYACSRCNKKFTWKNDLKKHMNIHLGIKPYACSRCDKKFTQKNHLKRHMNIHLGIKPYACSRCNKKFTQKNDLKQHMNIHLGIKPYACSRCDKKFTQKNVLKRHMNIHLGIKPYACSRCDKKFTQKCNLDNHIKTHLGIKSYECYYCGKMFVHKCALIGHIRRHIKLKLFKCTQCAKKFTSSSGLSLHAEIHSNSASYQCDICKRRYKAKRSIRYHIIRAHNAAMVPNDS